MNWLSQNWVWILFVIVMVVMMRRGGMGCGMGHAHHGPRDDQKAGDGGKPGDSSAKKPDEAPAHKHHGC